MLNTANARPVFYLIFCNCAVERISSRDPPLIKKRVSLARAARRFFADCRVKTLAAQNDAKGFSLSLAAEQAYARDFEEFIRVTGGDPFDYIISNLQNQTIHLAKPTFNTFSSAQDDGKGLSLFPSQRSKPSQETLKYSVKSCN